MLILHKQPQPVFIMGIATLQDARKKKESTKHSLCQIALYSKKKPEGRGSFRNAEMTSTLLLIKIKTEQVEVRDLSKC